MAGETPEVDYYAILGLKNTASDAEIKEAYRALAKKFHPDVNISGKTHEPNADKFREIAEAYAVLSVHENKMSYDVNFTKVKDAQYSKIKSKAMAANREKRDRSGHVPGPVPMRGSYAEYRIKELEKEREKFNVNHLGYYNGGLPQKKKGSIRGKALGNPGVPHNAALHNTIVRPERDANQVTSVQADMFKHSKEIERALGRDRQRPYYPITSDPEMQYAKNRTYASSIILGILGYFIAKRVYYREKMRASMNARFEDNLINAPAHHFVNRGGVLIKKEVVGFAKYFNNDSELVEWYKKIYPDIMEE